MINAQRQRVEQEMTSLVDNLDKTHMRKMQVCCLRNKILLSTFQSEFFVLGKYAQVC